MRRTFLLALDLPDISDPASISEDITDILVSEGYQVHSVNAWSTPQTDTSLAPENPNSFFL